MRCLLLSLLLLLLFPLASPAQSVAKSPEQIRLMVQDFKTDLRGPYRDIRWFCPDGSVLPPKERCAETGGVQRARYKEEVIQLGESNHIYLGQILSTTDPVEFWDERYQHARLKEYQVEKFLRAADEGWILRKGQYYRGAFQVEDEQAWGLAFLTGILAQDEAVAQDFFLLRQATRDLPHREDNNRTQNVRAVSKIISEKYEPFLNLRVKIHGQPEAGDLPKVKAFRESHRKQLDAGLLKQFDELIADMEVLYQPVKLSSLNSYVNKLPVESSIRQDLRQFIQTQEGKEGSEGRLEATAEMLCLLREQLPLTKGGTARLAIMDVSILLEDLYFKEIGSWQPQTVQDLMKKIASTAQAVAGAGFVESWEWMELKPDFAIPQQQKTLPLGELNYFFERSRSLVEWGSGRVRAEYEEVVNLYSSFEPLAYGFYDDRIRASVLLDLGRSVSELGDFIAVQANLSNQVMRLSEQSSIRGLNPGLAMGELVVVPGSAEEMEVSKDKIYLFMRPPSDLKPVAGIATVSEGNMVSHVQLLARNLGIPNAVISESNLQQLLKFSGQQVFYAVSNRGTVLMKAAADMTAEEKALFTTKSRNENKIRVPVEKIDLSEAKVLNMREVNAASSGKICGPKAANLGQLKSLFPDQVVEGLVIPFGIFRAHLDQAMPGQEGSYWSYLNASFEAAESLRQEGKTENEVEAFLLEKMAVLQTAIKNIPLLPNFQADLERAFQNAFGKSLGQVPIFIRSDTNMEDLKEFTGAGLNLTLFNVLDQNKIIQGIKEVWASPYTERSFKWRQRYLLNPENVFPSILIIPSVDVEYSGVLITKGIPNAEAKDLTIAFSRGAGGAVDGQAAESYLMTWQGENRLLSPARESRFRRLPASGGTANHSASFAQPILSDDNLAAVRALSQEMKRLLPSSPGMESGGPYDIELGFENNKIWLFQVRPFVENKSAMNSAYLESISPKMSVDTPVSLATKL